jgi:hypothetical protein
VANNKIPTPKEIATIWLDPVLGVPDDCGVCEDITPKFSGKGCPTCKVKEIFSLSWVKEI